MGGFTFNRDRARSGVVIRARFARAFRLIAQKFDCVFVFRMDHDHGVLFFGHRHNIQDLPIRQGQPGIGHKNLETRVTGLDQGRKILAKGHRIGFFHDQVKGHIGHALALGLGAVCSDCLTQGLAFFW